MERPANAVEVNRINQDHRNMAGAVNGFTKNTRAALVIINDDGEGADHEVYFFDGSTIGDIPGYIKLGILASGVAFVQDDLFDSSEEPVEQRGQARE